MYADFNQVFHTDPYGAKTTFSAIRVLDCGQVDVLDSLTYRRNLPVVHSFDDARQALALWKKWTPKLGATGAALDALKEALEALANVKRVDYGGQCAL